MNRVFEVDGPCIAYIDTPDGPNIYKTIGIGGRNPDDLVFYMNKRISQIDEALRSEFKSSIIYYRQRSTFLPQDEDRPGIHKLVCRLTTSPQLSDEFWEDLRAKEDTQ
jgi:hypothetical protein